MNNFLRDSANVAIGLMCLVMVVNAFVFHVNFKQWSDGLLFFTFLPAFFLACFIPAALIRWKTAHWFEKHVWA